MLAQGRPVPSAMLLNYGVYTERPSPSRQRYDGASSMLEAVEMHLFRDNYLRDQADRTGPLLMPLLAELLGRSPGLLTSAECDILADGNHAMALALREAGIDVEADAYLRATHSLPEAISISDLANRSIDDCAAWLQHELAAS